MQQGGSRFVEADVFSTLEQLEEAGSLSDPHYDLRVSIAAEYGLACPPLISCSPSPTIELTVPEPPTRRRSLLQRNKRPREDAQPAVGTSSLTLGVPLVGLVRRLSRSRSSGDDAESASSSTKHQNRRRSLDVERLRQSQRPRSWLASSMPDSSALSISSPVSGTSRGKNAGSRRPLSSVIEGEARKSSQQQQLDFAKRSLSDVIAPPAESGLALLRGDVQSAHDPTPRPSLSPSWAPSLARPLEDLHWRTLLMTTEEDASLLDTPELVRSKVDNLSLSSESGASLAEAEITPSPLASTIRPGDALCRLDGNVLSAKSETAGPVKVWA